MMKLHGMGLAAMAVMAGAYVVADDYDVLAAAPKGKRSDRNLCRPIQDARPEQKEKSKALRSMLKSKGRK